MRLLSGAVINGAIKGIGGLFTETECSERMPDNSAFLE
jgi:hypothetical protein